MARIPLQMVGAGPAGISMVLALCNRLLSGPDSQPVQQILDTLELFESSARAGGEMGRYRINANTSSTDVVLGIADGSPFQTVRDRYLQYPETQSKLIALPRIETLMVQPLVDRLQDFLGERLRYNTAVQRVRVDANGFQSFDVNDQLLAESENMLLCCGGREVLLEELGDYADRCEFSTDFLKRDNIDSLLQQPGAVVIVGASHSAFSCVWRLLHDPLFADFIAGRGIVMLVRRNNIKLRCSEEFAREHRVEYDAERDVCPQSGIVFHNGGLRKDAKDLYLRIRDGDESRVKLVQIKQLSDQADLLGQAALVLQSTGFRTNLPRIERDGAPLTIGQPTSIGELTSAPDNIIIPGLFGMGLGLNTVPQSVRGEASFTGSINGFQSYPLSIAPHIIDRILVNMKSGLI
ncbi:MAG: hypothetical protein ACI9LO_001234 [Planctomycetota bacterium]|jgi:hypothetical protein